MPAAACTATLAKASPDPVISFDPFTGEAGSVELALTIERADSEDCQLALAVGAEGAANGNRELTDAGEGALRYIVENADGVEYANNLEQPLPITTGSGGSMNVTLRFRVPAGQMAAAGSFTEQIRVRLVDLSAGNAQVADGGVVVTATVPSRAQVNLAGSAGPFDSGPFAFAGLDFGEMVLGEVRRAFVQVRATKPVTITLTSQNGGMMRRIGSGDPAQAMAYSLALDGNAVALTDGPRSIPASPALSLDGQSFPVVVQLTGDPDQLPAGQYRDVVTIEVTPN